MYHKESASFSDADVPDPPMDKEELAVNHVYF